MKKTAKTTKKNRSNGKPDDSSNGKSKSSSTEETKNESSEYLTDSVDDEGALNTLFVDLLKDIYWSEKYLVKKLPVVEDAATSAYLRKAVNAHWMETKTQVSRLEEVFESIDETPRAKKCPAMEGLIEEMEEIIDETDDQTFTRDVALIISAQKVEHYEIASYGGLIALAQVLGHSEAVKILAGILEEEKQADAKLTSIAEDKKINQKAAVEAE